MSAAARLCLLLAAVLALGAGAWRLQARADTAEHALTELQAAVDKQKTEAATLLATEIDKTRRTEQALQQAKNQQESKDAIHQQTVTAMGNRLRSLAGPAGRLLDPHAAQCGPGGGSTTSDPAATPADRAADPAAAGGLLSAQLSGLLQRLHSEADDINAAYASCRADAYTVRSGLDNTNPKD